MGLLKHFRSKSRLREKDGQHGGTVYTSPSAPPARYGRDFSTRLPQDVLARIFTFVCPHTTDESHATSEDSSIDDGCMLCDLRDVARCAQVARKWYSPAQMTLYKSVRIDAVHYCYLEEELAERRKKKEKRHFRSKSALEQRDIPTERLQLLCRTVREQPNLAEHVRFLKLPYMTRETAKSDLARAVSALPNLRHVDLPDGFFTGDPSCVTLRQELQMRCPHIKRMVYKSGSEDALELLAQRYWQGIETLELSGLALDPATLRVVLASLPVLRDLSITGLDWMDDTIFQSMPGQLPEFPAVESLKLVNTPNVTAQGLELWLSVPETRQALHSLTLQSTGVAAMELPAVLWGAPALTHLSYTATVTRSLALSQHELPPLTSISLKTLQFEILSSEEVHAIHKPAESHYAYLASSLHQNALPALQTLYVRDPSFPDLLLMPPVTQQQSQPQTRQLHSQGTGPNPATFSAYSNVAPPPGGAGGGFNQQLEVFSKGIDELEWVFTTITPTEPLGGPGAGQAGNRSSFVSSGGRPLSAFHASQGLGPQWANGGFGGEARKSVVVGNGFGGFLAVPQEEAPRPMTSDGPGSSGKKGRGHGSWASFGGGAGSGNDALKPPPGMGALSGEGKHQRRASKHDLWR